METHEEGPGREKSAEASAPGRRPGKTSAQGSKRKARPRQSKSKTGERELELVYFGPEASQVFLVGDFNDWNLSSLPMRKRKGGAWKRKLRLPAGRYEYKFLADGGWVHYVKGVERVPNPYGSDNFVLWVD